MSSMANEETDAAHLKHDIEGHFRELVKPKLWYDFGNGLLRLAFCRSTLARGSFAALGTLGRWRGVREVRAVAVVFAF